MSADRVCVYCHEPLTGEFLGAGDGTGQRFACPACYAREHAPSPRTGPEWTITDTGRVYTVNLPDGARCRVEATLDTEWQVWCATVVLEGAGNSADEALRALRDRALCLGELALPGEPSL